MDKPADPATPSPKSTSRSWPTSRRRDQAHHDRPLSLRLERFEQWLVENGHPVTLAALKLTILFAYRHSRRGSHPPLD